MAVREPPEGMEDEPKPPARLGRGGSISCCSKGRPFEKKLSHATLASDDGGGLAGAVPALARCAELTLTLTRGDAEVEFKCCEVAVALGADEEDDDAAELLLPEEDELPPLEAEELLDDFDLDEESTDVETRRAAERVDRGPQLEMNPLANAAAEVPDTGATTLFCGATCLSKARA